ncbi:MAG: hypothetical protein ABR985_13245 [Methanotrichaceae archaeon]
MQEKLLRSEYVNNLIKNVSFINLYNIIKINLQEESFRKLASKALLNQPAVIDEYRNQPKILDKVSKSGDKSKIASTEFSIDLIDILPNFNLVNAIEFYRKTIDNEYSRLYNDTSPNFFIPDSIKEFTDYDIILSPFTSFPRNDPMAILLRKPFERIYNDAYILNKSEREIFVKRAYAVYSNFEEILITFINGFRQRFIEESEREINTTYFELGRSYTLGEIDDNSQIISEELRIREDIQVFRNFKDYLEPTVRLAIYHWNIALSRFEAVNSYLNALPPEKCCIHSDAVNIWITDLQNGKSCSFELGDFFGTSLMVGSDDPFAGLYHCNSFKDLGLDTKKVTYDDVIHNIKSNLVDL